jgi:hypothetical protein
MASFCDYLSDLLSDEGTFDQAPGLFPLGSEAGVPLQRRSVKAKVFADEGFCETTEEFAFISDTDTRQVLVQ